MNDHEQDPALTSSLRELAELRPDESTTARAIERARAAVLGFGESALHVRRRRKMSLRYLVGVAAMLAGVMLLAHWWSTMTDRSSFAFGQVQERVEKVKSVQYALTRQDRVRGKSFPGEKQKVMILGSHQQRVEIKITTPGDPLPEGESLPHVPDSSVMIYDARTGKSINLYPDKKMWSPNFVLGFDREAIVPGTKAEPAPEVDFYKEVRDLPEDKAEKLPDRMIDGKMAAGFRVVEKREGKYGTDTWAITYWVDPDTKLPVMVENLFRSTNPSTCETDVVKRDFVFDAPLDESLFSTDPPEGYEELAMGIEWSVETKDKQ